MRAPAILPLLVSLVTLTLAACSPGETPAQSTPEPDALDAVLGEVNLNEPLRVLGTEPFWAVNIDGDGLVYSGVDRPEERAPNGGPQMAGTTATWSGQTDQGRALSITLIETLCSDGMSDRTYPLTARVQIGEEALNGCAASVDFLMNTDEQGQPRG
ncbi:MAG: COG3650 family protein [Brevundimonas sp.]